MSRILVASVWLLAALVVAGCDFAVYPQTGPNDEKAVELYRRAAARGDAGGQVNLGFMYERGRGGLDQDYVEAVRLYRLAAEQGNAFGQTNLAVMYSAGRGVPQNDGEAVRLLALAAGQGFGPAKCYLAAFYIARRGGLTGQEPAVSNAMEFVSRLESPGITRNHRGLMGAGGIPEPCFELKRFAAREADGKK